MDYRDVKGLVDAETKEELLGWVAELAKPGMRFVEVGCFVGSSLCYLGGRLRELGKAVELHAVDKWACDELSAETHAWMAVPGRDYYAAFLANLERCGLRDAVTVHKKDSVACAADFKDRSIDFIFLDGCHEEPYVRAELAAWLPKMKSDSVVAGHDYSDGDGIQRAVRDFFGENIRLTSNRASYFTLLGKGLAP